MAHALIQLTVAGNDTGPFNLYSNADGYVSAFESDVSKSSLLSGITVEIPVGTVMVRITSNNQNCSNYIDLPVLVQTTTSTSTTTIIQETCGDPVSYSGGAGWPTARSIFLGTATGIIELLANPGNLPDRWIVKINNVIVIDTGFKGSLIYDFGGSSRHTFRTWIDGRTDPITNNIYPDFTTYPDDGYPRVCCGNLPTSNYGNKLTLFDTAIVETYGSAPNTGWDFILYCPIEFTTTTTL